MSTKNDNQARKNCKLKICVTAMFGKKIEDYLIHFLNNHEDLFDGCHIGPIYTASKYHPTYRKTIRGGSEHGYVIIHVMSDNEQELLNKIEAIQTELIKHRSAGWDRYSVNLVINGSIYNRKVIEIKDTDISHTTAC